MLVWMRLQVIDPCSETAWEEHVVAGEVGNVRAGREAHELVERCRLASILARLIPEHSTSTGVLVHPAPDDLRRAVRRTIIDDEQLDRRIRLGDDALEAGDYKARMVEGRD